MPKTQQQAFGHASNKKPYHAKNHVEKGDTLIYALGGLGEVGKNMYCYEHENEICIVDCGVLFPGDELLGVDYVIPDYHHLIRMNKKKKVFSNYPWSRGSYWWNSILTKTSPN